MTSKRESKRTNARVVPQVRLEGEELAMRDRDSIHGRCPTCDSPHPNLHPAMQYEGEVQPCKDPYHSDTDNIVKESD